MNSITFSSINMINYLKEKNLQTKQVKFCYLDKLTLLLLQYCTKWKCSNKLNVQMVYKFEIKVKHFFTKSIININNCYYSFEEVD